VTQSAADLVVRREQRYRRLLLLGLAVLLVLSLSPVLGHHIVGAVDWLPATLQHLGPICLVALHHLLAPIHGVFHVLLALGVTYAVIERSRAAWRHRGTMKTLWLSPVERGSALARAVAHVGFEAARVHVVEGSPNPAFTSGWWRPQIYIAASLPLQLNTDELEAVLLHEMSHVLRRDPLRQFAWRTMAAILFWLPAIRRLVDELAIEAEIQADDYAARVRPLPLASAILRMSGVPSAALEPAVGFQRRDLVQRRVLRLAGEPTPVGFRVPRRSIVGAATMLLAVWASGVMALHPLLPAAHDASHCAHEGAAQWRHLFCAHAGAAGERCLHDDRTTLARLAHGSR
jgi:BlaR1 peptidase M56